MVDKTHPKYDSNIEAEQRKLKASGHFKGEVDGVDGPKTQAAREKFERDEALNADRRADREEKARADDLRAQELALEAERLRQTGQNQEAENAEAEAKRLRREEYARQETSPEGIAAKSTATVLAPAATTWLGYKAGEKLNERLNKAQAERNVTLRGVADDRIKGLTTREGAITGSKLAGVMPYKNPVLRTASRMGPHFGLGAIAMGKGADLLSEYDEDQPYYSRMFDRGAGLGFVGFGAGLMKRGIEHAASPGVPPDAQALAVINSNQLRRGGVPSKTIEGTLAKTLADPQPTALNPGTKAYMYQQAKDLKIPGRSKMTKSDLAIALADANIEHGGKRTLASRVKKLPKSGVAGPLVAGLVGYDLATGDAQAADGSTAGVLDETARGLTGGAMGVTGYAGGRKLANTLANYAPTAMKAMGGGLQMMMPMAGADMTDYSPQELAQGRNWMARNLPESMHFGAVEEAANMAQVPPPNPARGQIPRDPASLPESTQTEVQMLINEGVPPELIATYLNQIAAQQGAL